MVYEQTLGIFLNATTNILSKHVDYINFTSRDDLSGCRFVNSMPCIVYVVVVYKIRRIRFHVSEINRMKVIINIYIYIYIITTFHTKQY